MLMPIFFIVRYGGLYINTALPANSFYNCTTMHEALQRMAENTVMLT